MPNVSTHPSTADVFRSELETLQKSADSSINFILDRISTKKLREFISRVESDLVLSDEDHNRVNIIGVTYTQDGWLFELAKFPCGTSLCPIMAVKLSMEDKIKVIEELEEVY